MDNMEADLGGTEIVSALTWTLGSMNQETPASLFVLTDGEVRYLCSFIEESQ